MTAPSDLDDHLAPESSTILVLPARVLWVLINAEAVYAAKQQFGKTSLFQALRPNLLQPSESNRGVNQSSDGAKGVKGFVRLLYWSKGLF